MVKSFFWRLNATNALGGSSGHQRTPFLTGVQLGLNFFGKIFYQHCDRRSTSILFLTKICAILFTLLTLSGAVCGSDGIDKSHLCPQSVIDNNKSKKLDQLQLQIPRLGMISNFATGSLSSLFYHCYQIWYKDCLKYENRMRLVGTPFVPPPPHHHHWHYFDITKLPYQKQYPRHL